MNELAQGILIAPYVEEVEFRLVLQQYLLKNLPKTLIEKYFPNHRINFDSALSKGARILITAAIFAILHLKVVECEKGGAISQFLGGVLYSSLIESGASILTTMNIHLMFNLLTHIDYTAF
ncbi:MAG: CPBP family intramembrane metalloprotease [Chlamydiales bacterium]|nr:CPBP family intramembrane metalloprotease [Chlamydiales bacterium]